MRWKQYRPLLSSLVKTIHPPQRGVNRDPSAYFVPSSINWRQDRTWTYHNICYDHFLPNSNVFRIGHNQTKHARFSQFVILDAKSSKLSNLERSRAWNICRAKHDNNKSKKCYLWICLHKWVRLHMWIMRDAEKIGQIYMTPTEIFSQMMSLP